MVFKTLKILFIGSLLFLNAYLLYLFYKPNQPLHLKYIPQDANLVFSVNTKMLSEELAHSALFEHDQFVLLLEGGEDQDAFSFSDLDNGLNMTGRMTLINYNDKSSGQNISCFLVDVNDKEKFSTFLAARDAEPEEGENAVFTALWGESPVAFNNEVAAISSENGEHVLAALSDLLTSGANGSNEFAGGLPGDFHDFSAFAQISDPKKILAAFVNNIRITGDFTNECVSINAQAQLKQEMTANGSFLIEHNHAEIPDEILQEGFLNMHFSANSSVIFPLLLKKTSIAEGDSLLFEVFKTLSEHLQNRIMVRVMETKVIPNNDSLSKLLEDYPFKNGLAVLIPKMDIVAEINNPERIKEFLDNFSGDSLALEKDEDFYVFRSSLLKTEYFLHVGKKSVTLSYSRKKEIQLDEYFSQFSNWIWYDISEAFNSLVPEGNVLFQTMITGGGQVYDENIPFHHMYFYSTGEENGKMKWEGKLFFDEPENGKKRHTLIEFIRYIPYMMEIAI